MRFLILALVSTLLYTTVTAQGTCPPNIDFEQGNFSHWDFSTGTTYSMGVQNVIDLKPDSTDSMSIRHKIISADPSGVIPLDPYGKFPQLCPYGGKYSVKLGNDDVNAQAEGISYTFNVPTTEDTFSFTYFYAVVFQDPQHSPYEQPRFFVTAYETGTGNLINCASYNYISNGQIPGFKRTAPNSDILYKEWSPVSIQFVGLAGKQVTLEFKTGDCTLGGHFGYAYLDVGSGCSNILATAPYCIETNALLLNAPYGFKYYTWYNEDYSKILGTSQNLTLSPPPVTTGKFWVDLEPYPGYGCRDTVYSIVTPLPVPDTPKGKTLYYFCQNENAPPLEATPDINSDILWYTDTLQPGITEPIIPATNKAGTFYYYVSQKVLFGCESFKKKITVRVEPEPVPAFSVSSLSGCQEDNIFTFINTSTNLNNPTVQWDFGDTSALQKTDTVQHSYKDYGRFIVNLHITNSGVCEKIQQATITVVPKPVADFTYPATVCQNETVLKLSDQSNVPQQLSNINTWQWNINGTADNVQYPASFIPPVSGPISVSLVVTTDEGCISDTVTKTIQVRNQPIAAFRLDPPLCDNKTIHLQDMSWLPSSTTGEIINTWKWQVNSNGFTMQNPATVLQEGDYTLTLQSTTNYGCNSIPKDSFFHVFPHPSMSLLVSDSCVYRNIKYTATDLTGLVSEWYWDLGNGPKKGNFELAKYFINEGDNSFTLLSKTINGCTDTIYRPFTVFKNKAFAGYDTLAAKNQPVQLNAHGGTNNYYTWSPPIGLNDAHIENPVATYDRELRYRLDAITNEGCDAHSTILIKRYIGPDILIPTGFTPNRDGKNDILKAIPVGMKSLDYFAVYNRLGERVFYTRDFTKGWDGTINGMPAALTAYAVVAEATDYTGKKFIKRATVVLIR